MSTYKMISMEMARYNKWQNETVFRLCDELDDRELRLERGAFFSGLFGILNHILHTDYMLMDFIERGEPPSRFDPNAQPCESYRELKMARFTLDDTIVGTMDDASTEWFDQVFSFYSKDLGRLRDRPRALFISQMFNHQTHHRSQATALLYGLGLDYGSTDLPANPLSQS